MAIVRTLFAGLLSCVLASPALAQQVEVLWLGHSTFRITSVTGKVIVIDPFLNGRPRSLPAGYEGESHCQKPSRSSIR